jgi:hypothetical protein
MCWALKEERQDVEKFYTQMAKSEKDDKELL